MIDGLNNIIVAFWNCNKWALVCISSVHKKLGLDRPTPYMGHKCAIFQVSKTAAYGSCNCAPSMKPKAVDNDSFVTEEVRSRIITKQLTYHFEITWVHCSR